MEIRSDNPPSLQFDPAPRAGEPLVSRRVPDYFLVSAISTDPSYKGTNQLHVTVVIICFRQYTLVIEHIE